MSDGVRLVRAPNPSPMTLSGTNSYLVENGAGEAICIDPGPPVERHVEALLEAAREMHARIALICVTHGHPDHAPAAAMLRERTQAPVLAHPAARFAHDRPLHDGETCPGTASLRAFHAPGHTFDHLVFYSERERALFTGDVVLGEGTVVIAPPGGAMRPYQRTLERLLREFAGARRIYGGHGPPVEDPAAKLREYLAHRQLREEQLLAALARGPQSLPELVASIYRETDPALWPAAARQVLAYLTALEDEGRVRSHALAREMRPEERAILDPDWRALAGGADPALIEAELGANLHLERLRAYELR